jgi:hypothetical protein
MPFVFRSFLKIFSLLANKFFILVPIVVYNSKSMKIAFFYNLFPGGAQRLVYEQVKYLAKQHTVDVYTLKDKKETGFNPVSFAFEQCTYPFSLASKTVRIPKRVAKDWNNFISLEKLHKKIAHDIDKKKYDPQAMSGKAKPGKPGIYIE